MFVNFSPQDCYQMRLQIFCWPKNQHPKTGSLIRSYTQLTVIMVYFYLRLKSKATLSSLYWCVSGKKSTGNSVAAFICDQKSINLNHNWLTEKNLYLYNTNYIVTKWLIILKIIFYVCKCYASACAVCTYKANEIEMIATSKTK